MSKSKIFLTTFFFFLISTNLCAIVLASGDTIEIGDDLENDLRKFDYDTIVDEFDDFDAFDIDALDEMYDFVETDSHGVAVTEPPEIDILKLLLKNVKDSGNATLIIQVAGEISETEYMIGFYIWSDCGETGDNWACFGLYVPAEIGGDEYGIYWTMYGDDYADGFNDDLEISGSELSMLVPNDNAEKQCCCKCVTMAMDWDEDTGEPTEITFDIFNSCDKILGVSLQTFFDLLLYIIAIGTCTGICVYARYKSLKPK